MFGDYAYGTEILNLPPVGEPFKPIAQESLQPLESVTDRDMVFDAIQTYWFRWITGHQIMLTLWHILNKHMQQIDHYDEQAVTLYTRIIKGTTLVFEYTGSCTEVYYQKNIRPYMLLTHKAFSGKWASDYIGMPKNIQNIFSKKDISESTKKQLCLLRKAHNISQKTHLGVAKKLVPEGVSLLKDAKQEGYAYEQAEEHHQQLFDAFFLVRRTPISAAAVTHNLARRLHVVIDDLNQNPLTESLFNPSEAIELIQDTQNAIKTLTLYHPTQDTEV